MKPCATLLALGLVCVAAADEDDATGSACVATPAQFVANLEAMNYQMLDRPNVALFGTAAAPPDNASMAYDLKYLLSVDQRLQRLETTGTLAVLPKVDYRVRLLTFLYLSMWFCAFAVFEYALVNMHLPVSDAIDATHHSIPLRLFRIEARVEKARDKAEAECGIEQCINQMFAALLEHAFHAIDATPARLAWRCMSRRDRA